MKWKLPLCSTQDPGGPSQPAASTVNKAISQLAQRYCGDCRNSFDELSKIIQQVGDSAHCSLMLIVYYSSCHVHCRVCDSHACPLLIMYMYITQCCVALQVIASRKGLVEYDRQQREAAAVAASALPSSSPPTPLDMPATASDGLFVNRAKEVRSCLQQSSKSK